MEKTGTILTLKIDCLPPTVNHFYRSTRGGRRYKTRAGVEFQEVTVLKIKEAMAKAGRAVNYPYLGAVGLSIQMTAKDNRRWDLDNRLKAVQDCLQIAGVIKDDSQITELFVVRHPAPKIDSTRIAVFTKSCDDLTQIKETKVKFRSQLNRGEGGTK